VGTVLLGGCGGSGIEIGPHLDGGGDATAADGAVSGDAPGQADAPSCTDGYRDGAETDIDCGGGACQPCDDGFHCLADGDCASGHCSAQRCVPAPCVNGTRDGNETDVDCGGGTCAPCEEGKTCGGAADCLSGVCTGLKCAAPACDDTVVNGQETDVDCGGPVCPACALGRACVAPGDCVSRNCVALVCVLCINQTIFSWEAPNTNLDGTCLTDLGGYRLYYGETAGFYTEVHLVDLTSTACVDSGTSNTCGAIMTCTYEVDDLPAGTWYFAMTAYDLDGNESTYSNEVSKTIVCE
jgi:hypothetical protein